MLQFTSIIPSYLGMVLRINFVGYGELKELDGAFSLERMGSQLLLGSHTQTLILRS